MTSIAKPRKMFRWLASDCRIAFTCCVLLSGCVHGQVPPDVLADDGGPCRQEGADLLLVLRVRDAVDARRLLVARHGAVEEGRRDAGADDAVVARREPAPELHVVPEE